MPRSRQLGEQNNYVVADAHSAFNPRHERTEDEFSAGVVLMARREPPDNRLSGWRFHYLLGADAPLCARKLGIHEGRFWQAVYRLPKRRGKAFTRTQPYGLWQVSAYFAPCRRRRAA
jgi:hypothetical protein